MICTSSPCGIAVWPAVLSVAQIYKKDLLISDLWYYPRLLEVNVYHFSEISSRWLSREYKSTCVMRCGRRAQMNKLSSNIYSYIIIITIRLALGLPVPPYSTRIAWPNTASWLVSKIFVMTPCCSLAVAVVSRNFDKNGATISIYCNDRCNKDRIFMFILVDKGEKSNQNNYFGFEDSKNWCLRIEERKLCWTLKCSIPTAFQSSTYNATNMGLPMYLSLTSGEFCLKKREH